MADMTKQLEEKAAWVWREMLKIHRVAPETRLASSLSPVQILTALFYGGLLKFDPANPFWEGRDRFVISKGHGTVSFYPILADLGFFPLEELARTGQTGSFLSAIPDTRIPGYETINGSLGHGPGVATGMALALKRRGKDNNVVVLTGDGELFSGAIWEAVMLAGQHGLDNITLIVDWNKLCMLDYCRNIVDLTPIGEKFAQFGWWSAQVDGHDVGAVHRVLGDALARREGKPKVVVADTVKAKGVPQLECDSLCHIRSLKPEDVDRLLG